MVGPLVTIGGISLATAALRVRDPHRSHSWGACPLYATTGVYCPGCGGLRAVNDLTHGQVGAALSSNLVLTLVLPLVALGLAVWLADRWRGVQRTYPRHVVVPLLTAAAVALAAFTVARNLPGGAWLAP